MRRWWGDGLWWILLVAGALAAAAYAGWQGGAPVADPGSLLLLVLVFPALEELLFRGLLQPALYQRSRGALLMPAGPLSWANIVTSLMFALSHLWAHGVAHAAWVILPSLCFGLCRDRYGSVLPGFFLHAGWNAVVFAAPIEVG